MALLNLGILAHIDAGKTSLTERFLYVAGARQQLGSVDQGSTLTDSMELERQRGITIRAAVASFMIGDTQVNLLDTPGHPDFIAEVERVLGVLDGAVLVVSAVEGVQAQTRILARALRRLNIPTIIFINKIDRQGADPARVLQDVADRLTSGVVAMGWVSDPGGGDADFHPYGEDDSEFRMHLIDILAKQNDGILAAYVENEGSLPFGLLRKELANQTGRSLVFPVFFGSAITGHGTESLMSAIPELLLPRDGDTDGEMSATVFKIDRETSGEKIAYVRVFAGTVTIRSRVSFGNGKSDKITRIAVFANGTSQQVSILQPGQIGMLWGLAGVRIGDTIGMARGNDAWQQFAPPTLETVILPHDRADKGALNAALNLLAEQDPLINLRQDDIRQETYVSLYGEVQKEVIEATLASEFGVRVEFRETTTICVERPAGAGEALEVLRTDDNPYLATVGLRVEPGAPGSGVTFELGVELGSMPLAFFRAVEETVQVTLRQGLRGWQVIDCAVTMTRSGYLARQSHSHGSFDKSMSSTATDFRYLTPMVLMSALQRAGTIVCEPIHQFRLELPADLYTLILPVLAKLGAVPLPPGIHGELCTVEGSIPAARVHELQLQLPSLSRGEGVLESEFERWERAVGTVPERPRSDISPLERVRYLLANRR